MIKLSSTAERGQVMLLVVLLLVVVLTIGLSLATKNITNLRQASEEDNSQRAFSAAEAGIEVALNLQGVGRINETPFTESTTYTAEVKDIRSYELVFQDGRPQRRNDAVDVWLAPYPSYTPKWNGPLIVAWGNLLETDCNRIAALEIAVLSGPAISTQSIRHFAYDPCALRRSSPNNFTDPGVQMATVGRKQFRYSVTLPAISNGTIARIIPVYADTSIAVTTNNPSQPLPVQGKVIEAVGKSGETQRKIVVIKGNPKFPLELFPYTLFTPQ